MLRINYNYSHPGFTQRVNIKTDCRTIGIAGPSGGGKTTLLYNIAGIANPESGTISLGGSTLFDSDKALNSAPDKRAVGFVFQDNQLFPHLSVKDNILYGYRRLRENSGKFQPDSLIELLELGNLLERPVNKLSGGEAKRVAVARALARSPEILLLDEPFSGLDRNLADRLLAYLIRVRDNLDIMILSVSHNIRELVSFCKLIAPLEINTDSEGTKISRVGDLFEPIDFFCRFAGQVSALELENNIVCSVEKVDRESGVTNLRTDNGSLIYAPCIDISPGGRALVSFSAGEVLLARDLSGFISARNRWECKIISILESDGLVIAELDCGHRIRAEITGRTACEMKLKSGGHVTALLKVNSVRITPL